MNPLSSLLNTLFLLLSGRIYATGSSAGATITMENGQDFVVFRQMSVRSGKLPEAPGAVLIVRFHVLTMSPQRNKLFSLLPIPFFVGLPGFRGKLWTLNEETGDFQGIYEWDSIRDAENYARSFAMKFMERRSVAGSVSYRIVPGGSLKDYVGSKGV